MRFDHEPLNADSQLTVVYTALTSRPPRYMTSGRQSLWAGVDVTESRGYEPCTMNHAILTMADSERWMTAVTVRGG